MQINHLLLDQGEGGVERQCSGLTEALALKNGYFSSQYSHFSTNWLLRGSRRKGMLGKE